MHQKPLIVILLALWSCGAAVVRVSTAEDYERYQRPSLKGLKGVGVTVEKPSPELERDGVTGSQLQTDVDLRLRKAGIRVLTDTEWQDAPGYPYLYVRVSGMKSSSDSFYSCYIEVEVRQRVFLARDPSIVLSAVTWSAGGGGFAGVLRLREVRQIVIDQVDQFINAYLAVNPEQAAGREQSQPQPRRKQSTSPRPSR